MGVRPSHPFGWRIPLNGGWRRPQDSYREFRIQMSDQAFEIAARLQSGPPADAFGVRPARSRSRQGHERLARLSNALRRAPRPWPRCASPRPAAHGRPSEGGATGRLPAMPALRRQTLVSAARRDSAGTVAARLRLTRPTLVRAYRTTRCLRRRRQRSRSRLPALRRAALGLLVGAADLDSHISAGSAAAARRLPVDRDDAAG